MHIPASFHVTRMPAFCFQGDSGFVYPKKRIIFRRMKGSRRGDFLSPSFLSSDGDEYKGQLP